MNATIGPFQIACLAGHCCVSKTSQYGMTINGSPFGTWCSLWYSESYSLGTRFSNRILQVLCPGNMVSSQCSNFLLKIFMQYIWMQYIFPSSQMLPTSITTQFVFYFSMSISLLLSVSVSL